MGKSDNNATTTILLQDDLADKDKVENPDKFATSLFEHEYKKALLCLADIVNAAQKAKTESEKRWGTKVADENNIIAFIGDRGTGKTSALKSFVDFLSCISYNDSDAEGKAAHDFLNTCKADHEKDQIFKPVETAHFVTLHTVEPSQMGSKEGIIEVILANLYNTVKDNIHSTENMYRNECKVSDALTALDKASNSLCSYRNASKGNGGSGDSSPLESLDNLAYSQQLRKNIKNAIAKYMELVNEKSDKTYLVVPIDDLDMNISSGFYLAEEIRKFLMLPNVVIVMAMNINQFSQLVTKQYLDSYGNMVDKFLEGDNIIRIAEKYVTKFLPVNRRIYMPNFSPISIASYKIDLPGERKKEEAKQKEEAKKFVNYFFAEIYRKTGLILTKNNNGSHEILPDSLRTTQQLYALLHRMPDVNIYKCIDFNNDDSLNERKSLSSNLEEFTDYLMHSCFASRLSVQQYNILQQLYDMPIEYMNKFILQEIKKIYNKELNLDLRQRFADYSIGDVLYALKTIQFDKSSLKTQIFIEAIKIIYSITVTKLLFVEVDTSGNDGNRKKIRELYGDSLYTNNRIIETNCQYILTKDGFEGDFNATCSGNYIMQAFVQSYPITQYFGESKFYFYKNKYNNGSTGNVKMDFTSVFLNLIYPNLLLERVTSNTFDSNIINNIDNWCQQHISVIPIWSLDYIDSFFYLLLEKIRVDRGKASEKFTRFLKNCKECINALKKNMSLNEFGDENYTLFINQFINKENEELFNNWSTSSIESKEKTVDFNNLKEIKGHKPIEFILFGNQYKETSWVGIHKKVIEEMLVKKLDHLDSIKRAVLSGEFYNSIEYKGIKEKTTSTRNLRNTKLDVDINQMPDEIKEKYPDGIFANLRFPAETAMGNCKKLLEDCGYDPDNDLTIFYK